MPRKLRRDFPNDPAAAAAVTRVQTTLGGCTVENPVGIEKHVAHWICSVADGEAVEISIGPAVTRASELEHRTGGVRPSACGAVEVTSPVHLEAGIGASWRPAENIQRVKGPATV